MQFSFPRFPSLISFGAAVVTHSDGTLPVELSIGAALLGSRRARAGVCIHILPVVIFLVDGRFGIGSDQDQQERESVMDTLW
jgi:hypothetical protein